MRGEAQHQYHHYRIEYACPANRSRVHRSQQRCWIESAVDRAAHRGLNRPMTNQIRHIPANKPREATLVLHSYKAVLPVALNALPISFRDQARSSAIDLIG